MFRHLLRPLCLPMRSLRSLGTLQDLRRPRLRWNWRLLAWLGWRALSAGGWAIRLDVLLGLTWLQGLLLRLLLCIMLRLRVLLLNLTRRRHVRQTILPISVLRLTVGLLLLLLRLLVLRLIGGSHVGKTIFPAFLLRLLALLYLLDLLVVLGPIMRLRLSLDLRYLGGKAILKPFQSRLVALGLRLSRLALRLAILLEGLRSQALMKTLQVWTLLLRETLSEALWMLLTLRVALRWRRANYLLLKTLWSR